MPSKNPRIELKLEPELMEKLNELSKISKKSRTEILSEALRRYLEFLNQ